MRHWVGAAIFLLPAVAPFLFYCETPAQAGNSVSGVVYGLGRQPLSDVWVELMDNYRRTINRTRTSSNGYYEFRGFNQGRYYLHAYPYGSDFEEQEQEFEVQNFLLDTPSGSRAAGFADETRDFHLKLRAGVNPANVVVFVQNVPPEAEKHYKKALSDLDAKKQEQGLAELRRAIELFPQYFAALERLGSEYIRIGRRDNLEAAAILLDSAVQVNPRSSKGWYGLAYAHFALGSPATATVAVQKAIEISPLSPDILFLSGAIFRSTKKYKEAEQQLLKARDLAKGALPQVHRELGLLYGQNLGKYPEAVKELKQYLKDRPDAGDADELGKLIAEYSAKF